ncbi:MAG: hypothetical protein ABJC04_05305 [Verrucomicrobiota bacterium]
MKRSEIFLVVALALSLDSNALAQISVGLGGTSATITFDSSPVLPATEWASSPTGIGANSDSYFTAADVIAAVQTVNQNSLTNALSRITVNGLSEDARHNTAAGYLVTQSTSEGALLLKATLRNTSGQTISHITVNYNFGVALASSTESAPGHQVFFSTNGAANSWQFIPPFSGLNTPAFVSATLSVGQWLPNTDLYLLWADDNNGEGPDAAYTIDNFSVSNVIVTNPVCVAPFNLAVSTFSETDEGGTRVYYQGSAEGTPPFTYQWTFYFATSSTIVITSTSPTISRLFGPFDEFPVSFYLLVTNACGSPGVLDGLNPPCGPICLSSSVGIASTLTGTSGSGTNFTLTSSCGQFPSDSRWFLMSKLTNAAGVAFVTTEANKNGTMLGVFRGGINPATLLSVTCNIASNNQPARVEFETRPNSNYWLAVKTTDPATLKLTYGYQLKIAGITRSNNTVTVRSDPLPSLQYDLLSSTNLSTWTNIFTTNFTGNISTSNNVLRFLETNILGNPRRFYQIRGP